MRVTPTHWEAFLEIAEKNPTLITNKFNGMQGKALGNTLWNSVAVKLNGLGYGEKTINEWRRAITDWKSKVKSKAAKIRNSLLQTGGGSSDALPLTPLEQRLLNLMGTKSFEGDRDVQELGQTIRSHPETSMPQVINEIEVVSELSRIDKSQSSENILHQTCNAAIIDRDHQYPVNTKRRINEVDENDHTTNSKRPKRQKICSIPRISKNLVEMTAESLTVLRNIDRNTSRIADSFQDIVGILKNAFRSDVD